MMLEESFQVVQDRNEFRYSVPTTQARQDQHLEELLSFCQACKEISKDIPDDTMKHIPFF
jgi:hypothetical protein